MLYLKSNSPRFSIVKNFCFLVPLHTGPKLRSWAGLILNRLKIALTETLIGIMAITSPRSPWDGSTIWKIIYKTWNDISNKELFFSSNKLPSFVTAHDRSDYQKKTKKFLKLLDFLPKPIKNRRIKFHPASLFLYHSFLCWYKAYLALDNRRILNRQFFLREETQSDVSRFVTSR